MSERTRRIIQTSLVNDATLSVVRVDRINDDGSVRWSNHEAAVIFHPELGREEIVVLVEWEGITDHESAKRGWALSAKLNKLIESGRDR